MSPPKKTADGGEAMDAALRLGCDRLEMAMVERALAGLAPWSEADAADPYAYDPYADDPPGHPEPAVAPMTPDDALRLLKLHRQGTLRKPLPPPAIEQVRANIIRKLDAIERHQKS